MLLNLSTPLLIPAAWPDMTLTDPRQKTKAWTMQGGRALISSYRQSGSRDFFHARQSGRAKLAELYANGEQEVKAVLKDEQGRPDAGQHGLGLRRPLKILKKTLRAVDGKLKDHDFVATVTPIDATAQDERTAYEAKMRVMMEHGQFLKSLGLGSDVPEGEVPMDDDELDVHMQVKYRHRDAMLLEMKLALALYKSNWDQQNRQCLRDDTVYGSDVVYLQRQGACRLPKRLNPGNCFFLPSDTEDYDNLQAGAHLERVSLAQVLKEIDADPDTTLSASEREQLETLAKQSLGRNGYGYYYDDSLSGKPELAGQLEVVRFSFKSHDEVVQKEYVNKFGNKQVRDKPAGYVEGPNATKGKVHRQTVASWYEGTLIVGTEIGYGCRKAYEQLRDEENPFDCHPFYIVTSPDLLGGHTESIVEQAMVLVDMANEAFVKLRYKLNTLIGSWYQINVDSILENTAESKDGPMDPAKTMQHFFKNGWVIGKALDDNGQPIGPIITPHELPFAAEITEYRNTIADCREQIEAITGINGSISAADPASRQGAGVTQMAIQGAENTLEYLYFAKQRRFERVIRALAVSIKQSEARQPLTGAVQTPKGVVPVGTSDTLASRVMEVRIERKPTAEEWKRLYDQVSIMLTQQLIEPEDAVFIQGIDNLKQAGAILSVRAKRKRMQAAQTASQQSSMQGEQASMSAKTTAEEARKTLETEYSLKMQLEELKGRNTAAVAEIQKNGHLDAQELLGYLKLQQQESQQSHQAQQAATAHDVDLTKHDASLSSNEAQAEAQRAHEAELAAAQPVAAGA